MGKILVNNNDVFIDATNGNRGIAFNMLKYIAEISNVITSKGCVIYIRSDIFDEMKAVIISLNHDTIEKDIFKFKHNITMERSDTDTCLGFVTLDGLASVLTFKSK